MLVFKKANSFLKLWKNLSVNTSIGNLEQEAPGICLFSGSNGGIQLKYSTES